MSNNIIMRYPTRKLFEYVGLLNEKEQLPVKLTPVDEYNFVFFISYKDLKEMITKLLSKKYEDLIIETEKNKIIFYLTTTNRFQVISDLNEVIKYIYNKFKVRIGLDVPSDNELIVVMNAEPLAVEIAQLILREVKKKNNQLERLFKFKKGEVNIPEIGYSFLVYVNYIYTNQQRLQDVVDKL